MNRTHLVIAISVAFFSVLVTQSNVPAASIEMSMVTMTEEGTIASSYSAPCPLYDIYEDGYEKYGIGYSESDQGYVWETPEGRVTLVGMLDPDPMIAFGGAVIDFGAPSNFGFIFTMALSPQISNPSRVSDSFSGSVTNGAGAGVTVTALAPPAGIPEDSDGIREVQVYTLSDDFGASWQNVGLDLMPTTTPPLSGGSGLTPAFSEGPIATIAGGPWTELRADVNFRLTGGGDIFTFNGLKVLVPEPGTVALLWVLLATCCCSRRLAAR